MIFSLFDGEVLVISSRHIIPWFALFMLISPVIMFFVSFFVQVGCTKLFSVNSLFNCFFASVILKKLLIKPLVVQIEISQKLSKFD